MAQVLLVEDNPEEQRLVGTLLERHGHTCRMMGDGAGAVAEAKAFRPDVILLDIVMPGQDGFATCRQLKRDPETKAIPVVFVSARTGETDEFWGKKLGAVGYVHKPYTPEQLYAAIDAALKGGA
jgi:twitching motility two-component system response regulator PilH